MNIYRNLQIKQKPVESDLPSLDKTLGGWVMAEAKRLALTAPTHMDQITDAFYRGLVAFKWRWTPGRSCGDLGRAAALLDGETVNAECQVAANAFKLLLETAKPYGFGLVGAELKTYVGEKVLTGAEAQGPTAPNTKRAINTNEGFYSAHPLDGVHGLKPNVFDAGTNKLAPVYAWTDHKVVEVGSRYYDVCYNAAYTNLIDMAIALTLGSNVDSRPTKDIMEAMSRIAEYKVVVKNCFQIAYFRSAAPGSLAAQVDAKEIGPYAESIYGDEATVGGPFGGLVPMSKWASGGV